MKTNTMVMFSAMAASTVGANAVFFSASAVQGVTATGYAGSQAAGSAIITTGQPISAVLAACALFVTDPLRLLVESTPVRVLTFFLPFRMLVRAPFPSSFHRRVCRDPTSLPR